MSIKWKLFCGFVMGFLFLPLVYMLDKYVGPGAGSIAIAMVGIGISVATCVWLIEKMRVL
jgi:hypothetical protein